MPILTALILAAFVGYGIAWYTGVLAGDFALLLMLATCVTGIYWVAEKLFFLPRRRQAAQALSAQSGSDEDELTAARERVLAQPWWLDWTAGLFPVIAVVFLLRSFVFEPFRIPSGSMLPTLLVGDLILVNKYTYGLRLPVFGTRLTQGSAVQRGDVVVFRYPPNPRIDYIKRVVGLPGDEVAYLNKRLSINGRELAITPQDDFLDESSMRYFKQWGEQLDTTQHNIILDGQRPAFIAGASPFPSDDQCRYSIEGVACRVPDGHLFVMGDNRDNSLDSRYWGFVPHANLVGKAFFIWMNFSDIKRIGSFN
ncbi:MAG: signal peptidase I [Ottowia sp.]|nr:signal peptidase I [Ottowia sp.]